MTRNWIATASRTLGTVRSGSASPHRRSMCLCLESLEHRLALSSYSVGGVAAPDLNPQLLPPGRWRIVSPQIVGNHTGTSMVQGAHIGTSMVQGNHIGFEMVVVARKH
jgi:hypothetical protein